MSEYILETQYPHTLVFKSFDDACTAINLLYEMGFKELDLRIRND